MIYRIHVYVQLGIVRDYESNWSIIGSTRLIMLTPALTQGPSKHD